MIARYPVGVEINGFDYYGWQAQVAAMGATEIVFDVPKFANAQRFRSIIEPGPVLLGLAHRYGTDGQTLASSRFRYLCPWARANKTFPRLQSVIGKGPHEFTVTMRRQAARPDRNSDQKVWRTFADEIGAHVIDDYDDQPIHLHERMRLYAGARMNFGIVSGPLTMCSLSAYPCVTFGWEWCWGNGFYEKAGVNYGENMPWCGPEQYTIWAMPTLDLLRRWFDNWKRGLDADGLHVALGHEIR